MDKLKKGKINFEELIKLDFEGKKNFKLAKKGLYVSEENCQTKDEKESEKRSRHFNEKMEIMKSPNFKISDVRVVLKNVGKEHDESSIRKLAIELLEDKLGKKEIKNKKVIKNVKVLKDENKQGRSKVN